MTATDDAPAISLTDVHKVFPASGGQSVAALERIGLDVRPGAFVSLLGPSGCGKSTLLRIIADLTAPTTGTVTVGGRSAREARLARDYGLVFQQAGLLDWRTVRRNVELPLQVGGVSRAERRAQAEAMLDLVRLGDVADRFPWQLSGGMQQRVAIARALACRPQLLLMDEPLGALDEMTREYLQGELLRIWRDTGTTVVFVTHSVSEAVFLSTDIVIMSPRPGRITRRIEVGLPQPRTVEDRTSPAYFETVTEVRKALHAVMAEEPA
ncbi:ABC transporter ATP-binding protein [Streptomyces johnsoniae]|uniref:ABC transporter ATP-binding protein n=1 Tax=Streptomyces johnsoniae TaxID=3075532 RepID=A0ABU2S160_9ACTN|nr:ABC transporter ATP-binding protein [Streptomyces sp. DSM 41886]MDT0442441.1 ABC transporter ATP-binding protein [Streptomyces sp. DSM 41886]